jgi:hypothetical protein
MSRLQPRPAQRYAPEVFVVGLAFCVVDDPEFPTPSL